MFQVTCHSGSVIVVVSADPTLVGHTTRILTPADVSIKTRDRSQSQITERTALRWSGVSSDFLCRVSSRGAWIVWTVGWIDENSLQNTCYSRCMKSCRAIVWKWDNCNFQFCWCSELICLKYVLNLSFIPAGVIQRYSYTVEPDLITTEMLAFPSKSSRNKSESDLTIAIL